MQNNSTKESEMPRPKKNVDLISQVLELASGKLSVALNIILPTTRKRIEQAINRHPDLRNLLEPVEAEMTEYQNALLSAKAAVRTAIAMVWKKDE
jgi:hypothetical protein